MRDTAGTDAEVVLFARAQGNFLGGCVASIHRAASHAEGRGLTVALTAVLHAPTPVTRRVAESLLDARWRILDLPTTEVSAARNAARESLRGRYVAFIDGDDLWCETWLHAACRAALVEQAVWRPELLLTFGNDFHAAAGYAAIPQPAFLPDPSVLLARDVLPSGFLAPQGLLAAHPWPQADRGHGWEAVDRWWACEVAASGHAHRALPGTFHYRRRPDALRQTAPSTPWPGEVGRIGPTRLAGLRAPHLALAARSDHPRRHP
jgi:hypothetical protein